MNKPCGTSNKPPCARGPWIGLAALAAFAISGLTFAQTKLYVVNAGSDDVSVIDTKSGAVSKTIKGPGHLTPIAYNAAKGLLYLPTQESPGHVHFIDPNTDTFGETWMEVGNGPIYMLVSSEFDRAYVSNFFGGVSVLDTTSESQVTEITTLVSPVGAAMEPTASKMYVINSATSEISVIDANTNSPIRNIPLGCFNPLDIKLDVVLHKAFAAKNSCSELAVLETAGDSLLTTIKLPGRPQYIVIDSQTHRGYVTYNSGLGESGAKGGLAVIDTSVNTLVTSLTLGKNPARLALDGAEQRLYIADRGTNSVFVVDTTTNAIVRQIAVGSDPTDLALVAPPAPRLSVSEVDVTFDPQMLGTISTVRTVTLKNGGNANLTIQSATIVGDGFRTIKNTCSGVVLLHASVCYIGVAFAPSTAGAYAGTISIVSNDSAAPKQVRLSGTAETRTSVDITKIVPTIGQSGTAILVRGRNFGAVQATSTVRVGGVLAEVNDWSPHQVEVLAPAGLSGVGGVMVTTKKGTSNAVDFNYAQPDQPVWKKLTRRWSKECDGSFGAVAVHPANPKTVYIAGSAGGTLACGIFASTDAGSTWKSTSRGIGQIGTPPRFPSVSRIAIAPSNPKVIYLGTFAADSENGGVMKSIDAGVSWVDASGPVSPSTQKPAIQFPVLDLAVHPQNPQSLFAATRGGVYKTTNAGGSWTGVVTGANPTNPLTVDNYTSVKIAPSNAETVFIAGFKSYSRPSLPCKLAMRECTESYAVVPLPALKTLNGGQSWSPVTNPAKAHFMGTSLSTLITDIAIGSSDEHVIVGSTMSYIAPITAPPVVTNNAGAFKSEDGASNWTATNATGGSLRDFPISRLVVHPTDASILLALTGVANTVFLTKDAGMTWERLSALGLEDGTLIFDIAFAETTLYGVTSRGVYKLEASHQLARK